MSEDKLQSGLRNIESAVIAIVRQRGGSIDQQSFIWQESGSKSSPPELLCARVRANARIATLIIPRECCEESASSVNRIEVLDAIKNCAGMLAD